MSVRLADIESEIEESEQQTMDLLPSQETKHKYEGFAI